MKAPAVRSTLALSVLCLAAAALPASAQQTKTISKPQNPQVERGRYLVKVTGCNDCHTPGYPQSGGKVDEKLWLTGDKLGWRGPWGTTYAVNLRLYLRDMSEAAWVKRAKTMETRPPMPWFALHDMTEQDLKAIYQFVRTLSPAGEPAPAFVAPGREPQTPYIQFPSPPK